LFGYRDVGDAEAARRSVREGRVAFAVLLPPEFSRQALLGTEPGAGRLILYVSEGNNYAAAGFAKRFAPELAHRVNETLNERRWALVFDSTAGSQRDLASLRQGVDRLVEGAESAASAAHRVREGTQALTAGLAGAHGAGQRLQLATAQLADGAVQLGGGLRQLGAGLRAIDARAAPERDLQSLRQGGRTLARGHTELAVGLLQLQAGAGALREGAAALKLEGGDLPFVGERIAQAAEAMLAGAEQIEQGLEAARGAQVRLAEGTQRLADGTEQLGDGLSRQTAAVGQLAARLPDDSRVESFAAGASQAADGAAALVAGLQRLQAGQLRLQEGLAPLDDGTAELAAGVRLLRASLPAGPTPPEGTPAGLAHSVQPVLEVVAPVASEGAGFAPNFVPLALWMGAVMTGFLFHFRRLPQPLMAAPRAATVTGRLVFPALVVVGQSLAMLVMLAGVLHVPVPHLLPFAATLLVASLVFLSFIFALVHLFGDAGKMAAVLLLVVQMSAAGALLPIELSAPAFQAVHPWLPLTWVVRAFRASLFGAFDGAWVGAVAVALAAGAAALMLATVFGRWQAVPAEAYRPTLEVD
jgi:putative membrane protein